MSTYIDGEYGEHFTRFNDETIRNGFDSGIRLNDEGSSCCVITIYCLLASVINNLTVACRSLWLGSACKMGHSMK